MVVPAVREIARSDLPSLSPLVSLLAAWEPDGGARGPGNSQVLSPIIISSCLPSCGLGADGGAGGPGNSQVLVSHHNLLLSPFL